MTLEIPATTAQNMRLPVGAGRAGGTGLTLRGRAVALGLDTCGCWDLHTDGPRH